MEKLVNIRKRTLKILKNYETKTDLYSNRDAIDTLYMNNRIPSNSKNNIH